MACHTPKTGSMNGDGLISWLVGTSWGCSQSPYMYTVQLDGCEHLLVDNFWYASGRVHNVTF